MIIPKPISTSMIVAALLSATAGTSFLRAQSSQESEEEGEIITMTPFVISADNEIGYQATQTLSGTRLRSNLKDVGPSVDVLTREFLDDVMAFDMYEALDYVGNVSTWALSGSDTEESNQEWWGLPYYARGFLSNTVMTDFFARVEYSPDSYSVDSFAVSRGPSAVLYGIGQPGGVVNVSRKRPIIGGNANKVGLVVDDTGGYRVSGDFNKTLIEDALAVRLALVDDDRKGFRDGDFKKRRGVYGAVAFRPLENTTFTLTYEDAVNDRAIGSNHVFYDAVTPWIEAGMPIYDAQSSDPIPDGIRRTGVATGSPTYIQGRPDLGVLDWSQQYIGNYFPVSTKTSFTNETAIFDITNLISGPDANVKTDYRDLAIFAEQKLADNMFLELAYNNVQIDNEVNRLSRIHDFVVVDVNKYLPDGVTPNPYAGVPYLDVQRSEMNGTMREYETFRGTYTWKFDLNEYNLGRYTLLGMYEDVQEEYLFAMYRMQNGEPLPGANSKPQNSSNRVRHRVYLNSTVTPDGVMAFDRFHWDEGALESALPSAEWGGAAGAPRHEWTDRKSWVAALQGDFFPAEGFDRLSLMYGLRHDDNSVRSAGGYSRDSGTGYWIGQEVYDTKPSASSQGFFDPAYDGYGSISDPTVLDDYTQSYSAIFRPSKNLMLYYNYSDVLIAGTATQVDIYGNPTPPTKGVTNDIGIRFDFLDDKVYASLTYFETVAENQAINDFHVDHQDVIKAIYEVVGEDESPYNNFSQWYSLRDDESSGVEISLTGNFKGTTARLSVSHLETVISQQLPVFTQWVEEQKPLWEQYSDSELISTPENLTTVGEAIDFIDTEVGNYHATVGNTLGTQRDWKVNFTVSHRFQDGILKNWGIGGNLYWESADIVGYAIDPVTGLDDASRGFDGDALFRFDPFISYRTNLFEDSTLTLRLHVRNAFDNTDYFPREAFDDGTGSPVYTRLQLFAPRTFTFSADLSF